MIGEIENVGAVAGEGMARWSQNGFATSCQCRYDVAICWMIWVVGDRTSWVLSIDSHRVTCASRSAYVVLEDVGSRVSYVLVRYAGEGQVVLMCSACGSSAWCCSSCTVQRRYYSYRSRMSC